MADEDKISELAKKYDLEEDVVRKLSDQYREADEDNSGSIDREELKALLRKTIPKKVTDKGLDRFLESQWRNIDNDGSGSMDFDEFLYLYDICFKSSQDKPQTDSPAPDTPHVYENSPTNGTSDEPITLTLSSGDQNGSVAENSTAETDDVDSSIITTNSVAVDDSHLTPNQTPVKQKKPKHPSSEKPKSKQKPTSSFSTPPPKSRPSDDRSSYSPTLSPHSAHLNRSGDVFEKLYNDALMRRERRKQREEDFGRKGKEESLTGPSVTDMANKMNRSGDVWTSLYNDSVQRRERREQAV
eukprot:TRINITY_DN3388_c0_g1_i1.p1 TRINITY_DN3388_c0_g1~~TRINITY_DN3388_c0_g1_i1.p1  ORF type:complete len:299 (+),score=100.80 TRINITY_DN3388_c0_g1_i1:195-1091(+)